MIEIYSFRESLNYHYHPKRGIIKSKLMKKNIEIILIEGWYHNHAHICCLDLLYLLSFIPVLSSSQSRRIFKFFICEDLNIQTIINNFTCVSKVWYYTSFKSSFAGGSGFFFGASTLFFWSIFSSLYDRLREGSKELSLLTFFRRSSAEDLRPLNLTIWKIESKLIRIINTYPACVETIPSDR